MMTTAIHATSNVGERISSPAFLTCVLLPGFLPRTATVPTISRRIRLSGPSPRWPHSANWGYYPSGGLGIVLIVDLVLLLTGRL